MSNLKKDKSSSKQKYPLESKIVKTQGATQSLKIVLPRDFVKKMHLRPKSYLKVRLTNRTRRLIIQKVK